MDKLNINLTQFLDYCNSIQDSDKYYDISVILAKSGIKIKKKNRGKFTEYCGGKVTDECIKRAKKSKNPKLRKRAVFAENARGWS